MTSNHLTGDPIRTGGVDLRSEVGVVPGWAWALAVLVYLGVQAVFHVLAWPNERNPPALPFRVLFPLFIGVIPAFYIRLVGYVNSDAGRRGMKRALWTLIVTFTPNAIGFIIYFLLRHPVPMDCPRCGTRVDVRANYCPKCAYGFRPTCPRCRASIPDTARFCPNCGHAAGEGDTAREPLAGPA